MIFQHSGKIGDLIAAIPTIMAYGGGSVLLKQTREFLPEAIEAVKPLLISQGIGVQDQLFGPQKVDINLDLFRAITMPLHCGQLAQWYWYAFHKSQAREPWLKVEPNTDYADAIVINRTLRYRNNNISYRFLQDDKTFTRLVFLGVKSEAVWFKTEVRRAHWAKTKDMLEAAQIIAGCKMYIGNQSSLWWVAEGLGKTRVLETYPAVPNCMPLTPNGYDILYEPHFEDLVRRLYGR